MTTTEEKFLAFVSEQKLLRPGVLVTVGVSGGADSVCLLFLLQKYRETLGIRLQAVHLNHRIRACAGEDAAFVRALCEAWEVPCVCEERDVPALAGELGCSVEDAGRRARYEAFRRAGGDLIAVAHQQEDQAETMLLHLFRGSGLRGLGGMAPVSGEIIRPLLCLSRGEIEELLRSEGIAWREDETNAQDAYARNRIRHRILTEAEDLFPGAARRMSRTARQLREAERYLEQQTQEAKAMLVSGSPEEGWSIDRARFCETAGVLRGRVLLELLESLSPGGRDIFSVHVELLEELCLSGGNGRLELPCGIRAEGSYGLVRLCSEAADADPDEGVLELATETEHFCRGERTEEEIRGLLRENLYTKVMDYAKIRQSPQVRPRQTGDYFLITGADGALHRQTVKDYMINRKIPAAKRDRMLLVADGSHCLWLPGYRMSDGVKVSAQTEEYLVIHARF